MLAKFIIILLAIVALPYKCLSQDSQVEETNKIMAQINDEIITENDMRKKIANNMPREGQESYIRRILQQMSQEMLFKQTAKKLGIEVLEAEVDREIDTDARSFNSKEDFNKYLKFLRMDIERYREEKRKAILVRKLLINKYQAWITTPSSENPVLEEFISPEEIKKFYEENKTAFAGINEIAVGVILLKYDSAKEKEEKRELAESTLRRLKDGTSFDLLAREVSDSKGQIYVTGLKKGQTGFPKEIDELLFEKLKESEISNIMETSDAFSIFKLMRKISESAKTYEDAQFQIKTMLEQQKRLKNSEKLLNELTKKSYIWPPELFEGMYK